MREDAEVQLRTLVFFSVHSLPCSSWICILVVCQVAYWKLNFLAQQLGFLLVKDLFFTFLPDVGNVLLNAYKWYSIGLSSSVPLRSCKGAERQCCHCAFAASQISWFCGLIGILHPHTEAAQEQCTSSVPLSLKLGLNWFNWSNCRQPGRRCAPRHRVNLLLQNSTTVKGALSGPEQIHEGNWIYMLFDSTGVSKLNC